MNRTLRATLAVGTVAVTGLAAFLLTQALAGGEQHDEPWLVPLSQPITSVELDPDLPVLEALAEAEEEFGVDTGLPVGEVEDLADEAPSEEEVRAMFALDEGEPLPDEVLSTWGPGADAPHVDLTARGISAPELDPAEVAAIDSGAPRDPVPSDDGVWEGIDPALPFVARELAELGADEPDDAEGELGDPAALDELLFRFWGSDWPGLRFVDDVPLLELDARDESDFHDVCAATIDDVPVECVDGFGGTVLPLMPPLEIIAVAIDHGPRCAELEAGGDLPVRITFNLPISSGDIWWGGISDGATATRHELTPDVITGETETSVVHHCLRLPTDPQSRRYRANVAAVGLFGGRTERIVEVSRPPSLTEGRPPTSLEPLGDRRMLVHVPAREGGKVTAHVVVRDPEVRGLGSQCDPEQLTAETTDWGRWAGPGEPVRIRPAHRMRTPASTSFDPTYIRTLVYDLSFRSTELDEPMSTFELCLTWLQGREGAYTVAERENHLISPPARPIVEVFVSEISPTDVLERRAGEVNTPYADISVRSLTEATNGTSTETWGRHHITDGSSCSRQFVERIAEQVRVEPLRLCRFELTEDRHEVLLGATMLSQGPDGNSSFDHERLVRLPGHPSHPNYPGGCTRCVDHHVANGWFTRGAYESGVRPDAFIRLQFVVSGDAHERWLTLPLLAEEERPDQPVLDVGATTVELWDQDPARGIDLSYTADRPVQATLVARPSSSGRAGASPAGCPAPSVPHVVTGDRFEQHATLSIRDVCALTPYRFALELIDEDGNRAVYGDLLSWFVASQDSGLLAGDDAYQATSWQPRLRTAGHRLRFTSTVETYLVLTEEQLPAGVHVGDVLGDRPPRSSRRDAPIYEHRDDFRVSRSLELFGEHARLRQLDVHLGSGSSSFGELAGGGLHCLDPVARYGPRSRTVEVGDLVPIAASGFYARRGHSCGWNFRQINPNHSNGLWEHISVGLPAWSESPTNSTTYLVDRELLEEAGRTRIVLHSPARCMRWTDTLPEGCFDGTLPWFRIEAVVTVDVRPDNPPSRTLIGEFSP